MLLRELVVPVDRAGLYVPGGRATYPSTVLMTAIPARVAGVPEIALCVPPDRDGRVPHATLAAAALVGVDEVYRVGGAQAIAALAYGTETIRPVDVIVGPGNVYVAAAKREVAGIVGIESLAGPSELVVVADDTRRSRSASPPTSLAQAEHGPGGAAILVTWDDDVADAVDAARRRQLAPTRRARAEIEATLHRGRPRGPRRRRRRGDRRRSNAIAPEHLELITADPDVRCVPLVRNAGAVFCGPWSPAVVGDYVAGVNHVLPTARTARFASALRVDTFRKHVHVVTRRPGRPGAASRRTSSVRRGGGPRRARARSVDAAARTRERHGAMSRLSRRATTCARSRATTRRSSTCRCGSTPTRARTRRRRSSSTRGSTQLRAAPLNRYPDRARARAA